VSPLLNAIYPMRKGVKFAFFARGGLHTNVVLRIRPIDADESSELTI